MTTPPSSSTVGVVDETQTLIPGLPNDVAAFILSLIPYSHHARLKPTCKSWRLFLTPSSNKSLFSLRRRNRPCHLLCIFPQDPSLASPFLFDPENLAWAQLPTTPPDPHSYGLCNFAALSIGAYLYVLGGSLFDNRSFPIDRPSASSSASRFDFTTGSWEPLAPMVHARGSFGCAAIPGSEAILVAGGGSRHCVFGAAGSRMSSVERYDIRGNRWVELERLTGMRAGCVGFFVEEGMEFWVMGGYGEERTIGGVLPVDEYCRDAVVMDLKSAGNDVVGGKWRVVGDMWEEGERVRLGKIVVVEDQERPGRPGVFMLEGNDILRYDMASNRWWEESHVPKKAPHNSAFGFVVLDGELHVMTLLNASDPTESRRKRNQKRAGTLYIQIYHPKKKTWRSLITKSPFPYPLDFKTAVVCSIQL
ncbi:F-box/kelch-repeat protein OR23 [Morella rubra]|uniref:F-box/kelch-repeat protein OR23 n=1 Tax=Morella rubra TaxID=262757 RepID=A0A6A1VAG9_9ROSI|nr:F-box/kelch-repeat protein OR23 [Morella rubra]